MDGVAIAYDISDPEDSFKNAGGQWNRDAVRFMAERCARILVGTKYDLDDSERNISYE